jgi:hypothetical protein
MRAHYADPESDQLAPAGPGDRLDEILGRFMEL